MHLTLQWSFNLNYIHWSVRPPGVSIQNWLDYILRCKATAKLALTYLHFLIQPLKSSYFLSKPWSFFIPSQMSFQGLTSISSQNVMPGAETVVLDMAWSSQTWLFWQQCLKSWDLCTFAIFSRRKTRNSLHIQSSEYFFLILIIIFLQDYTRI